MAAVPQAVGFKHSINSLLVVAIYIGTLKPGCRNNVTKLIGE
jgi:hypothetical protein